MCFFYFHSVSSFNSDIVSSSSIPVLQNLLEYRSSYSILVFAGDSVMGADIRYEISLNAYIKLVLHALKHKTASVNGILLSRVNPKGSSLVQITDSVPLFHSNLALLPPLEIALIMIEEHYGAEGIGIVGWRWRRKSRLGSEKLDSNMDLAWFRWIGCGERRFQHEPGWARRSSIPTWFSETLRIHLFFPFLHQFSGTKLRLEPEMEVVEMN